MWPNQLMCLTWRIYSCGVTYSYVWHDTFICVIESLIKNVRVRHRDTATHCNTLQRTATHCNTLQHTAIHCNTLQYTATHCNTGRHCDFRDFVEESIQSHREHYMMHDWFMSERTHLSEIIFAYSYRMPSFCHVVSRYAHDLSQTDECCHVCNLSILVQNARVISERLWTFCYACLIHM